MANEPKRWRGLPRQLWKQGWFYTLVAAAAGGCVAVAAAVGQTDVGFILSGWSVFWFGLATSIFAAWIWLALAASRARGHHVPIRGAVTVFILLAAVSLTIATTTGDRRGSGYLIELELRNPLPAMMRTNYGDIAKLAQVRFRPGEPAVTEMERPHNLWMLVFGHVYRLRVLGQWFDALLRRRVQRGGRVAPAGLRIRTSPHPLRCTSA